MSINAFGVFFLTSKGMENYSIDTSFVIQNLANKNRIGLNQGANLSLRASNFIKKVYGFNANELRFEITDFPLDCNAEFLFGGYSPDDEEDETLEFRMSKVQSFFREVFNTGLIIKIDLYINLQFGDPYPVLDTSINDFVEKVVKIFIPKNGWTPSVKIIINK